MSSLGQAFAYNILETSKYNWPAAAPVIHYVLTVLPNGAASNLEFEARNATTVDEAAGDIADMARRAEAHADKGLPAPLMASPLDIPVGKQAWLLIRLDPEVNWQFTVGQVPCTLKNEDLSGDNVYLRHVYKGDATPWQGMVTKAGCRTIFFGVAHRAADDALSDPNPGSSFINLNVEFLQKAGGKDVSLKLIIDPDVPNDAGGGFFP